MASEWKRLYREALRQRTNEKAVEACQRARRAINDRLLELAAQKIAAEKEREQLQEALRRLLIHEFRLRRSN